MRRSLWPILPGLIAAAVLFSGAANREPQHEFWSAKERLAAIKRAQVWKPTEVASMDIRKGPDEPGAFAPGESITCDYIDRKPNGKSPKFLCEMERAVGGLDTPAKAEQKPKGDAKVKDELKVKYGANNGETFGEVAGTRLLWALGFGADRMYPVRVLCRGCPPDPAKDMKAREAQVLFDPAAVERKFKGSEIETKPGSGWAWTELDLVDEKAGGAPVAQRDALRLLAVFMQHTDSKPEQQRLVCIERDKDRPTDKHHGPSADMCAETMMIINDLGLTFGHATLLNTNESSSANLQKWTETPIWTDENHCVGNLVGSQTGTLDKPVISEGGRKLLANELAQLTDQQIHDLFDVARFPDRKLTSGGNGTVDDWVAAFKKKREEIVQRSCVPGEKTVSR